LFKSKGLPSEGKEKENWCDLAFMKGKKRWERKRLSGYFLKI
jgi:hypothetical protein